MVRYPSWLMPLLIVSVVALAAVSVFTMYAAFDRPSQGGISATGEHSIFAEPDEATAYVRIDTTSNDSNEAREKNSAATKRVINALKSAGLTDAEIDTSSYNIHQGDEYIYPPQPKNESGEFVARHVLRIRTSDIDSIGDYIDIATENGATGVDYISFSLSETRKDEIHDEVFRIATERAKERARNKADLLDVKLGRIVSVSENDGGYYPVMERTAVSAVDAGDSTEINPQSQEYRVSVTLVYEIR